MRPLQRFLLGQHLLATFLALLLVALVTGWFGGRFILRQARQSFLQALANENDREASRIAHSIQMMLEESGDPEAVLGRIQTSLSTGPVDDTGFVCLMDSSARLISHPNPGMIGMDMARIEVSSLDGGTVSTLIGRLRAAPHASILQTSDFGGRPHLVFQSAVKGPGWVVSVHTDLEALEQRLRALSRDLARTGVPVLAFFTLAGTFAVRRVERFYEQRMEELNHSLEATVNRRTMELQTALTELVVAKDQAESADRLKGEFLGVMGHEYRTPLNAILGFSSLLADSELSDEQAEFVDELTTSAEHLLNLIERVLQFAAIESGRERPVEERVMIEDVVNEAASPVCQAYEEKKIEYLLRIAPECPPSMELPWDWMIRVVRELLDNAFKFTEEGRVTLDVSVSGDAVNPVLTLSFRDTGCGIAEERLDELCSLFTQGDGSMTRRHDGIGLGLVMVHRIIERIGGELRVTRNIDHGGTEVICHMPVKV